MDSLENLTKAELQDRCSTLGLSTTGNKDQLIRRLADHQAKPARPPAPNGPPIRSAYTVEYPIPDGDNPVEHIGEHHEHYLGDVVSAALEAGHQIRGGAARIGWGQTEDGKTTAVYQVLTLAPGGGDD